MVGVLPATTSLQEFSAERAMAHVNAIALKPHPIGSEENERVRDYIIGELADIGIQAEIQETTVPDYFGINNGVQVRLSPSYKAVFPKGLSTPADFPNLTRALLERGYSGSDVQKIIGKNFLNLFREVWD